jgi:exopolysaccharide biosynthesis polyprenyl glycosylphosphotransferase
MLDKFFSPTHFSIADRDLANFVVKNDIRSPIGFKISSSQVIYKIKVILLLALDSLAITLGWLLATVIHLQTWNLAAVWQSEDLYQSFLPILIFSISFFVASDLYGKGDRSRNLYNVTKATTLAHLAFVPIALEVNASNNFLSQLLLAWILTSSLVCGERSVVYALLMHLRQKHLPLRRKILLLGNREDLEKSQVLLESSEVFQIEGKLDLATLKTPHSLSQFLNTINYKNIDEVFVCSWQAVEESIGLFWKLKSAGIDWRIMPIDLQLPEQKLEIATIKGIPTIRFDSSPIVGIDFFSKRIFDIVVASGLLLVLGIPLLTIALLIRLDSPGDVFYRQTRVGLKGQRFQVWKFRTMIENASQLQAQLEAQNEVQGGVLFKIKDDPRITKVGKFLRRYSLDELPQLFNVLQGDMSLVGPRPLPVRDVEKFSQNHFFRHEVLPGITGLWQVSGRSDTDSDKVFDLDIEYIKNWSLALDFKILLKTVQVVLIGTGAY